MELLGYLTFASLIEINKSWNLLNLDTMEHNENLIDVVEKLMEQTCILKVRLLDSISHFQSELCLYSNKLSSRSHCGESPEIRNKSAFNLTRIAAGAEKNFEVVTSPSLYVGISAQSMIEQQSKMVSYSDLACKIQKIQDDLEDLRNKVLQSKTDIKQKNFDRLAAGKKTESTQINDDDYNESKEKNKSPKNAGKRMKLNQIKKSKLKNNQSSKKGKPVLEDIKEEEDPKPEDKTQREIKKNNKNSESFSTESVEKEIFSMDLKCELLNQQAAQNLDILPCINQTEHNIQQLREQNCIEDEMDDCEIGSYEKSVEQETCGKQPNVSKKCSRKRAACCIHDVCKLLIDSQYRALTVTNHHDKVAISPTTAEVVHYVNDSHIVICNYTVAARVVQWMSPKGEVITDKKGRVHVEEKFPGQLALVFEQISLSDKGDWTCMTAEGDARKSFKMVINRPISFMDTETLQSAREGKDATIRCEVKGDPEPTVSWSFNGKSIILPHVKFTKLADGLLIKKVSKNDSGEYTCRAFQISETINGVDERVILLKIEHKPLPFEKSSGIQYGYINGIVNLTCEALAEPQANFTWYRHGKKINPKNHSIFVGNHSSMLQIPINDATSFGDYKCKATNPLGFLEKTIKLQEGTKPDSPTQFNLRGVNSDTFDIDVGAVRTSNIRHEMDINGYMFNIIPESDYRASGGNWEKAKEFRFGFEDGVTFLINNLTPNTTYLVRVASKNLAGLSDWTETKKFTTYPKEPGLTSSCDRIRPLSIFAAFSLVSFDRVISSFITSSSDFFDIYRLFQVVL